LPPRTHVGEREPEVRRIRLLPALRLLSRYGVHLQTARHGTLAMPKPSWTQIGA
jgi:hypothetical protein